MGASSHGYVIPSAPRSRLEDPHIVPVWRTGRDGYSSQIGTRIQNAFSEVIWLHAFDYRYTDNSKPLTCLTVDTHSDDAHQTEFLNYVQLTWDEPRIISGYNPCHHITHLTHTVGDGNSYSRHSETLSSRLSTGNFKDSRKSKERIMGPRSKFDFRFNGRKNSISNRFLLFTHEASEFMSMCMVHLQ